MNETHNKSSLFTFIVSALVIATVVTSFLFWQDMNRLNKAYADIMQVEAISSTTQRLINLAGAGEHQERDAFVIGEATETALSLNGSEVISLMSDPSVALLANEVLQQWFVIEEIVSVNWNLEEGEEKKALNTVDLQLARDAHFKAMTDLSNGIGDYTREINANVTQYQIMIIAFAFAIVIIMLNNALQTRAELIMSKELAQKAQIDTATGLYNRSRCQELFKNNQAISDKRKPAIMVLDLNDLKKTNDNLGHRVGDELISAFANILKNACNIHTVPPFIGRYGGDEFIVFYEDIDSESELQLYLKELTFLTNEYNERESRFQVSYAVGYSYVKDDIDEKLTARQLFDKADEAMYVNKIEGKRAKNPNYDAEKEKGEVR